MSSTVLKKQKKSLGANSAQRGEGPRKVLAKSQLKETQLQAIDRLYNYDETLLIARVGFGKAIVALTAIQELLDDNVLKRVVVFAPLRVCTMTWRDEPNQWEHITADVGIACGNEGKRRAVFESPCKIVVTNLENTNWAIENYGDRFDGMVVDEITKLKTPSSRKMMKLRHWVKRLKWRAGMTGTPLAESSTDLYTQALILDLGKSLGTRYLTFKEKYFYPTDYERRNWELKPQADQALSLDMAKLVFMADDTEYWANLPPVRDHIVWCRMGGHCADVYEQMESSGVIEASADPVMLEVIAPTAATRKNKLAQIASGGVYGEDGAIVGAWDHKIKELDALMPKLAHTPVIIVYQYRFELIALRERHPAAPVLGAGNKMADNFIERWSRGDYPVLLMHPKSAAHGLNLQYGSHTLVHLSPIWGSDPWQQVKGRVQRRGQPSPHVDRYILVAPGTVDEEMLVRMSHKQAREADTMGAFKEFIPLNYG